MSTLSELSSKADYIATKNNHLRTHWRTYKNSLTQSVTHLNKTINHEIGHGVSQGISFTLFNHFGINVYLRDDFYSQDIVYSLNLAQNTDEPDFRVFAHAQLSEKGIVDGTVDIRDKNAVLKHYLNKISFIYQCLFDSLRDNKSACEELEKLLIDTKSIA